MKISRLTIKNVKVKGSTVSNCLLLCSHLPCFSNFRLLPKKIKAFLLELKKSILTNRGKLSLHRNILHRSAKLYLLHRLEFRLDFFEEIHFSDSVIKF